jgi:hypothetical protein
MIIRHHIGGKIYTMNAYASMWVLAFRENFGSMRNSQVTIGGGAKAVCVAVRKALNCRQRGCRPAILAET